MARTHNLEIKSRFTDRVSRAPPLKEIFNLGGQILSGKPKVEKQTRSFVLLELLYSPTDVGSLSVGWDRGVTRDPVMLTGPL